MNEPTRVYDVESGADARNIEAMRMLDRLVVRIVLNHGSIENCLAVVDKMHVITRQRLPRLS